MRLKGAVFERLLPPSCFWKFLLLGKLSLMKPSIYSALCFVLLVSACSGPGSDTGRAEDSTFRYNLGTSARWHIVSTAQDALLSRYGYRFNREVNTAEDVRLETSWREVTIFADEQAAGYVEARVRIFVNARPRNRAAGNAGTFSARMEAEIEAQLSVGGNWQRVPITAEREAYLDEIASYLENEFKAGVM